MTDRVGPILGMALFVLLILGVILHSRLRQLTDGAQLLLLPRQLPDDLETLASTPINHAGGSSEPLV